MQLANLSGASLRDIVQVRRRDADEFYRAITPNGVSFEDCRSDAPGSVRNALDQAVF